MTFDNAEYDRLKEQAMKNKSAHLMILAQSRDVAFIVINNNDGIVSNCSSPYRFEAKNGQKLIVASCPECSSRDILYMQGSSHMFDKQVLMTSKERFELIQDAFDE